MSKQDKENMRVFAFIKLRFNFVKFVPSTLILILTGKVFTRILA